jgi:hypothetical protein
MQLTSAQADGARVRDIGWCLLGRPKSFRGRPSFLEKYLP